MNSRWCTPRRMSRFTPANMYRSKLVGVFTSSNRNLYAIKPVTLSDIHSIRRHILTLGWQYIIIVPSSGLAFPPLYFYNGGVREFLATLKQHVVIVRSSNDSNVFLLNGFQDTLQKILSSLELPRVLFAAKGAPLHSSPSEVSSANGPLKVNGNTSSGVSGAYEHSGRYKLKSHDPSHDLSNQVLEKFSLVTKFSREATSQFFREFEDLMTKFSMKHLVVLLDEI